MRRTLEMTVIEGIKTSIPLHLKILAEPDFIAGRLSTSFMERYIVEKKATEHAASPRPCSCSARPLSVSIPSSTPMSAASVASSRDRWPLACFRGGARLAAAPRQDAARPRASSISPTQSSPRPARSAARGDRQRSRRHRAAGGGRRRARRAGRSAAGRPCATVFGDGVVGLSTHDAAADRRGAANARPTTSPSGRCSAPPPRTPATARAAWTWCGCAAGRGQAGRRDRRHHARAGAARSSPPGPRRSRSSPIC